MSKEEKSKMVPRLRFPEFVETDWKNYKLGDLSTNLDYKRIPITSNERQKGDVPYYGASGIIDYVKDYIFNDELLCVSEDGANLIDRNYPIAFSISGKTWVNNHAHVLKFENRFTQTLVEKYLNSISLADFLTGMAQPKLNRAKLDIIPINLPDLAEQQKIADCLSSLDDLLTAENGKLEALKAHKKGLMQQLFPAEGETVPKRRFAEFRDGGEWVEKALGKVAEIITGNTPPTNDSSNYNGERLFVSPADISGSRYITQTKTTLSQKGYSLTRHIKENSVLFVCIGSTIGKVAQNQLECATNQQINSLVPYDGYSSDFIYSSLEFKATKIAIIAGNQAVPIINKSLFSSVLVSFPSPEEQQKIADCLSSLDDLITEQAQKIEALTQHKKGLLQGLFPGAADT